jgi:hypothetical protein
VLFFKKIYFHYEKSHLKTNYWSLALNLKIILGLHMNEQKNMPTQYLNVTSKKCPAKNTPSGHKTGDI